MLARRLLGALSFTPPDNVMHEYYPSASIYFNDAVFDASDNVYLTGSYSTTDFVAKINAAGTMEWMRRFQLTLSDSASKIALDGAGNVYVLGHGRNAGSYNYLILAKYNNSGVIQWQRKLTVSGATGGLQAFGLVIDSSGNPYCFSDYNVTLRTCHLVKYNSSGTIQWQRQISLTSNSIIAGSLAIDFSDNVYVGMRNSTPTPDPAFVLKYDSAGTLQWQYQYVVNASNTDANLLVCDGSNLYFNPVVSSVVSLDADGNVRWGRNYSGPSALYSLSIAGDGALLIGAANTSSPYQGYLVKAGASDGSYQVQRKLEGSVSSEPVIARIKLVDDDLRWVGRSHTASGVIRAHRFDVSLTDGNGVYSHLTLSESTLTYGTAPSTVKSAGSLNDAAGSLIDAAGDMTDSALTPLTQTSYEKA